MKRKGCLYNLFLIVFTIFWLFVALMAFALMRGG